MPLSLTKTFVDPISLLRRRYKIYYKLSSDNIRKPSGCVCIYDDETNIPLEWIFTFDDFKKALASHYSMIMGEDNVDEYINNIFALIENQPFDGESQGGRRRYRRKTRRTRRTRKSRRKTRIARR